MEMKKSCPFAILMNDLSSNHLNVQGWQGKKKRELTKNGEVDGGSLRLFPVVIEDLVVCFTSDRFPILKTRGHEGDA